MKIPWLKNFRRAYNALPEGTSIMGIYGDAHVLVYEKDYSTGHGAQHGRPAARERMAMTSIRWTCLFADDVSAVGTTEDRDPQRQRVYCRQPRRVEGNAVSGRCWTPTRT